MISDPPPGPRAELARAAAARGEDLAGLSRLLGRNPAYIQQFVRRGIPRKLDGDDRRTLARYLRIDESLLGGDADATRRMLLAEASAGAGADDMVLVPRLGVEAAAGAGAVAETEGARERLAFSAATLREITGGRMAQASILRVLGDSMLPTLAPGDDILVVAQAPAEPLRDGIHVVRADDLLLVKRVMVQPGGGLTLISENRIYPPRDCGPGEVEVVGRVVWFGRRL